MNHDASSANQITNTGPAGGAEYSVIDLHRFVYVLWRRRKRVILLALGFMLVAYGGSWLLHPKYEAVVRLMPPNQKDSSLSSVLMPTHNIGDIYVGLLDSRTVADDVIARQHLQEYFHSTEPTALRASLSGMAKISIDKDQFITVTVRAPEKETAVRVANEFPAALYRLNSAVTKAAALHRWEFFAGPMEQERQNLASAEEDLKEAQQKTGMLAPDAQVRLGVGAIADLRQQLTGREEQLAALETRTASGNTLVVQLKAQIASLQGQVHALEQQTGGQGTVPANAKMPELTLEVERRQRNVSYHQALFDILGKQYENARVEESYAAPVELIDSAVLPDRKSWPSRKLFALVGLLLGGLLGLLLVVDEATDLTSRARLLFRKYTTVDPHASRS